MNASSEYSGNDAAGHQVPAGHTQSNVILLNSSRVGAAGIRKTPRKVGLDRPLFDQKAPVVAVHPQSGEPK